MKDLCVIEICVVRYLLVYI